MQPSYGIRICTNAEMKNLDAQAEKEFLIEPSILMENAGRAAAQILLERYPNAGKTSEILIFAGKGNNAGDAFVLARRLLSMDRKVRIFYLCSESRYQGPVAKNFEILKRLKAKMTHVESAQDVQAFFASSSGPHTIVDGILGTGLKGNLEGIYYEVIELINLQSQQTNSEVLAIDIPSGVSGDTGAVQGTSILANLTVSFGFPKLGHFLPPGAARRGELVNVDISLPARFRHEGQTFLLTQELVRDFLQARDRYGHKNSFGHTLLIGGSPGRLGAIVMAAQACHKMGTGLVTVATWEECFETLMIKLPSETMCVPIKLSGPEADLYKRNLSQYSAVVVGPGLGLRADGRTLLHELLTHYPGPLILDADALNLIAEYELQGELTKRRNPTVLTPHPGEMSRLIHLGKDEISENPLQAIRKAVELTHSIVLLKGAATLVASVEERLFLNHYPNDGMATAGSGDVLAGMIGGLVGQKMDPFQATLLGVYLHSLAGDLAAKSKGHRSMTAQDISESIGTAFQMLKPTPGQDLLAEGRMWIR